MNSLHSTIDRKSIDFAQCHKSKRSFMVTHQDKRILSAEKLQENKPQVANQVRPTLTFIGNHDMNPFLAS